MKTLKTTLLISMLLILTTSCTDLTDNLVPETKTENTELVSGTDNSSDITTDDTLNNGDTGGDEGNGSGKEN